MESELEVLMKCKCGWEETPHSEAQVPIRCTKCSATAVLPTAPWERGRYQRTVGALIEALKDAPEIAAEVRSPFTITIRARNVK